MTRTPFRVILNLKHSARNLDTIVLFTAEHLKQGLVRFSDVYSHQLI